jgi:HEAT repeat protein
LAALRIIGRRSDVSFLRQLTRKVGPEPSPAVLANLRRLESIPWIMGNLSVLGALHETEQAGAVQFAVQSSAKRQVVFEVVAYVLRNGKTAGRRVAAKALADFSGVEVNELVMQRLEDEDPEVRATLAVQLRQRGIPNAIPRLIEFLESPHQVEREAAQASLEEFQFHRFAASFENLSPEARFTTGRLVRRIDSSAVIAVQDELAAPTRSRRKRALEMVVVLGVVDELRGSVIELLTDEDQFLRIEAINVLATDDSQTARQALRDALLDSHPLVQQAAEAALARLATGAVLPASSASLAEAPT